MAAERPCIYKVPISIRNVKPEAYRPELVTIGLRDRSAKQKAAKDEAKTSSKKKKDEAETSSDQGHKKNNTIKKKYQQMESHKEIYLESFTERFGVDAVKQMKETIQDEEEKIRSSYVKSTTEWVSHESFVDHILKDSVFIMELIIRLHVFTVNSDDLILDSTYNTSTVKSDLMLLENQLPYFIFEKLFGSVINALNVPETVEQLILKFFSLKIVKRETPFLHFTDMYRCVYEDSLERTPSLKTDLSTGAAIEKLASADNLARVGVKFKTFDQPTPLERLKSIIIGEEAHDYSLHVAFNKGCLLMSFRADDTSDKILRNVIAYEQCHGLNPFTSNYIHFINFLITHVEDVEALTAEGVLTHGMGNPTLVVEMVNNLNRGLRVPRNSQYHSIAVDLQAQYKSRRKRCWATLNRVYFPDLLTGTATIAAILLLLLTLVGTVASVIQTYKSFK